jgi:hypothetical protein
MRDYLGDYDCDCEYRINPISDWLYHGTSFDNFLKIIGGMRLKPGGWPRQKFISFTDTPMANLKWVDSTEIMLVLRKSDLIDEVIQVDYRTRWLVEHPLHAAYIAEHPIEKYGLNKVVSNIQQKDLSEEREWITAKQGKSIKIETALVAVLCGSKESLRQVRRATKGILPAKYVVTYQEGINKLSGSTFVGEIGETLRLEVICEPPRYDHNHTVMTDEQGNQYMAVFRRNEKPRWARTAEKAGFSVSVIGRVTSHGNHRNLPTTFLNYVKVSKDEAERIDNTHEEILEEGWRLDAQSQAFQEYEAFHAARKKSFLDPDPLSKEEEAMADAEHQEGLQRLQRLIDSFRR